MTERRSWDDYFMAIASVAATRATCDRKHVGAVLVRDRTILSTGYNGSVRGMGHCSDEGVGHMMEDGHCVRTVHAEANAIIQAAKNGTAIDGATIYTTASPCWWCFKLIVNSGVKKIVFGELYRDPRIGQFATEAGIELVGPLLEGKTCPNCSHPTHAGSACAFKVKRGDDDGYAVEDCGCTKS